MSVKQKLFVDVMTPRTRQSCAGGQSCSRLLPVAHSDADLSQQQDKRLLPLRPARSSGVEEQKKKYKKIIMKCNELVVIK